MAAVRTFGILAYSVDPRGTLKKALEDWRPEGKDRRRRLPATEKEWENSLAEHLGKALPDLQIIQQGGAGMVRADIVIQRKGLLGDVVRDLIELKQGLPSTGAYQRLVGQIETYREENGWVFVVLCAAGMPTWNARARMTITATTAMANATHRFIFRLVGGGTGGLGSIPPSPRPPD